MPAVGAHQVRYPLLQALFMIAKPLPATSTAARKINKGALMCGSPLAAPLTVTVIIRPKMNPL